MWGRVCLEVALMVKHLSRVVCTTIFVGVVLSGGCTPPPPGMDMTPVMDDLSGPGGPDLWGNRLDLAGNPPDLAQPPSDMTSKPGDMAGPPADLGGGKGDMSSSSGDMAGPMADMAGPGGDMASKPTDMAGPGGDMAGKPTDMAGMSGDMGRGGAGIGQPCTDDTSCGEGPTPKCWKMNVLNNTLNPATPGGYCSSPCTADTDCGAGNNCVSLGMPGKFCLAGCNNATTCRHPGYACAFYQSAGVCFSDSRLDCDPKAAMGACTETGTGKAGGCLREAYEDKGVCAASCTVGPKTCAALGGVNRQCIFLDTTVMVFMDNWKGPICIGSPATPVPAGGMCMFLNDCQDGYQCDGMSGTCQQLCTKGGMPACMAGMCTDAFMTAAGGPGLCR